jgi:hypothetical protein
MPKNTKILFDSISVMNSPLLENQIINETPIIGINVITDG